MAERLFLGPIKREVIERILQRRARSGGTSMTKTAARRIVENAGPIPHDIQRFAYEVFDHASGPKDLGNVDAGIAHVGSHEAETHAEGFGG
jgi:hypothetical protein